MGITPLCACVTARGSALRSPSRHDFLRVHGDGTEFEILKIYYHPLPAHWSQPRAMRRWFRSTRAHLGSRVWTKQGSSAVLCNSAFRQKRVIVDIRTDSYFIMDSTFPILYRFDEKPAPPRREQYERSKTRYCFCDSPGMPMRVKNLGVERGTGRTRDSTLNFPM